MAKLSNCKSCNAEIRWVKSSGGKNMPVDADPVEDGNLLVDWELGTAMVLPRDSDYSGPRYNSHFVTCPNADRHRKPKPTAAETDAARDKAIAAIDPKKRLTEPECLDLPHVRGALSGYDAARKAEGLPPDPVPRETKELRPLESMDQAERFMLMLGEAISDDVEGWEPVPLDGPTTSRSLRLVWEGEEFILTVEWVTP